VLCHTHFKAPNWKGPGAILNSNISHEFPQSFRLLNMIFSIKKKNNKDAEIQEPIVAESQAPAESHNDE
jgi:hypothetical protein